MCSTKQPADVVRELRREWMRARLDPDTSSEDLRAVEVLGRAAALVDRVLGGGIYVG